MSHKNYSYLNIGSGDQISIKMAFLIKKFVGFKGKFILTQNLDGVRARKLDIKKLINLLSSKIFYHQFKDYCKYFKNEVF